MAIVVKKILPEGTHNPVVARLFAQTIELLSWARLPKKKEDKIKEMYLGLTERMLKLDQLVGRLIERLMQADREMTENRRAGRYHHLPQIDGLRGEVETFLYDAKNFLRILLGVLNVFFDQNFDEAKAWSDPKGNGRGLVVAWATREFGADDTFTKMLLTEQDWVGELIQRRNAVEHPGKQSGTLNVENIAMHPSGLFIPPTWWRDYGVGQNLIQDIETGVINLCTLAEDILVECIRKQPDFPRFVAFYEIPKDKRDPSCPKRIGVTLDESKLKPPRPPTAA